MGTWSLAGAGAGAAPSQSTLPENWEFTLPVSVGDEVEADLGGAFFPATVKKVVNSKYNVLFFDGDVMDGLDRCMIKLLSPPSSYGMLGSDDEQPPPGLTKKELKKWRKKQEKKRNKKKG